MRKSIVPNLIIRGILLVSSAILVACETSDTGSSTSKEVEGDPGWQITLQTSGGFAGIRQKLVVSNKGMAQFTNQKTSTQINGITPPDDLIELASMVKTLPVEAKSVLGDGRCRDCFSHVLQITENGQSRTIRVNGIVDPNAPVSRLLTKLNQLKTTLIKQAPSKK